MHLELVRSFLTPSPTQSVDRPIEFHSGLSRPAADLMCLLTQISVELLQLIKTGPD